MRPSRPMRLARPIEPADRSLHAFVGDEGNAGLWLGVEHEFAVRAAGRRVDFTTLIHGLELGQRHLDPADPHAYRLPSGAAWTCDGAEAEIALPPTDVAPGFSGVAARRAHAERLALAHRIGRDVSLEGCSTHLSVSAPDDLASAACRRFARSFAPALMLLMDRAGSPGLLVRPRPGRVELGGEFVEGWQLAVAAVFAAGSVLACLGSLRGTAMGVPPAVVVRVEAARERFGWYVDRRAFGTDLYAGGRGSVLRLADGGDTMAQDHLERCWRVARGAMDGLASEAELSLVDDVVNGRLPIPLERAVESVTPADALDGAMSAAYGSALNPRRRVAGFDVAAVMLTWELAVFLLVDRETARRAFAAVTGPALPSFLSSLDRGELDGAITDHLRRRPARTRLDSWHRLDRVGLYDEIGPRIGLLRPELGPDGRPMSPPAPSIGRRRRPPWRALVPSGGNRA